MIMATTIKRFILQMKMSPNKPVADFHFVLVVAITVLWEKFKGLIFENHRAFSSFLKELCLPVATSTT